MKVIPAVDILEGKVVSLYQGDFEKRQFEENDPLGAAEYFVEQGADEIHIVDLDGARQGKPGNRNLILDIINELQGVEIQVGGGIRSIQTAGEYLRRGAGAIIVGTTAVKNPYLIGEMIQQFGADRVIVSLDARNGSLALSGWEEESGVGVKTHLSRLLDHGVSRIIYTDISRDGTLEGPNIDALQSIGRYEVEVTVSGGISSQDELEELKEHGITRAIVGTALYEEEIDPEELWVEDHAN